MADGDKKDEPPPKTKGEQLAERLAGSNPVEPKPVVGEDTPPIESKEEPKPPSAAEKLAAWESKAKAAVEADKPKPAEPKAVKPAEPAKPKKQVDAERMPPEKKAQEAKESAGREEDGIPPPPPWYRTLRADPPVYIRFALGASFIGLIFLLWWFLTRGGPTDAFISPNKLTSPGDTFGSLTKLTERDLVDSILDSLQRVFLGVGLAALVGIVLGVTAGAHRGVSATIAPLVIFLRSVPMGALLPLTAMMFGDGEKQKWLFIFLAVVPFVFSDVVKAVASVPDRYVETAQTLGASRMQIIMKVLVPLSLPDIITSLRFQIGLALGYIILAEAGSTFVAHGLGKMIAMSERIGPREHIFLLLFVITLIAFGIDLMLRTLQRGVFPWRRDL
jgi:ABC-type nitrate/sulfonate/bicarbonate transport system permease component